MPNHPEAAQHYFAAGFVDRIILQLFGLGTQLQKFGQIGAYDRIHVAPPDAGSGKGLVPFSHDRPHDSQQQPMRQQDAYRMIRRGAADGVIKTAQYMVREPKSSLRH